jgi:hypothetical protein
MNLYTENIFSATLNITTISFCMTVKVLQPVLQLV